MKRLLCKLGFHGRGVKTDDSDAYGRGEWLVCQHCGYTLWGFTDSLTGQRMHAHWQERAERAEATIAAIKAANDDGSGFEDDCTCGVCAVHRVLVAHYVEGSKSDRTE